MADQLAKAATERAEVDVTLPVTMTAVKSATGKSLIAHWTVQWDKYPHARMTKQFYSFPCKSKAKILGKLDRQEMTRFINIVTGHNNPAYHASKASNDPEFDNGCRFCNTSEETFFHWVTDCPALHDLRQQYAILPIDRDKQHWSIDRLLAFSHDSRLTNIIDGDTSYNCTLETVETSEGVDSE